MTINTNAFSNGTINAQNAEALLHHYQRMIEAAGDVIYTTDSRGICTYVNASVNRLFGYSPEEVIGKSFTEFVPLSYRRSVTAFYLKQRRQHIPQTTLEFPFVTHSGEEKWVEQIVILMTEGETVFQGIMRDVTRRKQAEFALQQREANMKALMNNTEDAIWAIDRDYRVIGMNDTFLKRTPPGTNIQVGSNILDYIHPEYFERFKSYYDRALAGESFIIEETYNFDHLKLNAELLFNPIINNDETTGAVIFSRNLTKRKEAEAALRVSEEKFRTVTEAVDTVIFMARNGRIIYANTAIEQLTGYSREAIVGMNSLELVHPDYHDWLLGRRTQRAQGEYETGQGRFELQFVRRDGSTRWVELTTQVINFDGQVVTLGTALDITERKQAEHALRESEQHYRAVVEDQSELICRWRPDTTLTFVNEAYCRFFGKSRQELIGTQFLNHLPVSEHGGMRRQIEAALILQHPVTYENQIAAADGQTHWLEWTDRPILDDQKQAFEFQSVGRDVTERKQAEAEIGEYINRLEVLGQLDIELTQILKLDYVLKIALDAAVRLSHANAGAIHLIEGEKVWVAQVIGNYSKSLLGAVVTPEGIVRRVLRTQKAELITDVSTDPDYVPNIPETQAQITIPLVAQDRMVGVLNVQTNQPGRFSSEIFEFLKLLSARIASALDNARLYRILEDQFTELQKLYQQVSSLEQLKTQIIRIASHDLRNPLGVISGYLQMLGWDLETVLTDRNREHFKIIRESIDRMDKITKDILTLERVSANQKGLPAENVNLTEIVNLAYEDYRVQAADKKLRYTVEAPKEQVMVQGDRALLRETVTNLISNAIKYTPEGGAVRAVLTATPEQIIFEVTDTGYGIPEDQQANLFEPFYRAVSKETKTIKGIGLGLHLVKNIIERHKGQMHFHSVYGQGSTFGFELPPIKSKTKGSSKSARRPAVHR